MEVGIIVRGRVQGVNFRYYIKKEADKIGIRGYVCNLEDGNVLIIAQGGKNEIVELIDFIKRNPGLSRVEDVEANNVKNEGSYNGFEIIRNGNIFQDRFKNVFKTLKREVSNG